MTKRLIIDGNSIGHASQNRRGGKLKSGSVETTAIFGAVQTLRKSLHKLPEVAPIICWDGRSWRYDVHPDYKGKRLQTAEQKAEREAYIKQRQMISLVMRSLGVPQLTVGNMEADDMAAKLTARYLANGDTVVLLTGDQDWLQMVEHGVIWTDHRDKDRTVSSRDFEAFTGVKDRAAFVDVKALSGDTGDNVPGVDGIGKKGAIDLVNTYGSVANFLNASDDDALAKWQSAKMKAAIPAKYLRLRTEPKMAEQYKRARLLMDLYHPDIPRMKKPNTIAGKYDEDALKKIFGKLAFLSILNDFDRFMAPFRSLQENK